MLDWQAVQDGYVITSKLSDWQVWKRSQVFGGSVLAEALEVFIDNVLGLGYEVD